MTPYIFQPNTDWFSKNLPYWEKYLLPNKNIQDLNFLEIGSFEGRSSVWLLDHVLTHPTARLTCVDTFAEPPSTEFDCALIEKHFLENITASGASDRVSILKGYSVDILPTLTPRSFDFIYVDASHKAKDVLDDAVFSWRLLKRGGLLFFDDYRYTEGETETDRPKMAIDAFLAVRPEDFEILDHNYQFYIRKLTP